MKKMVFPCLTGLLLIVSCGSTPASGPSSSGAAVSAPPGWTSRTSFTEGSQLVFVLSGPETADVSKLALAVLTSSLDLPIRSTTTPAAAEAIQKYLKKVSQTVPVERYLQGGRAWWKLALSKEDWNRNRSQLLALYEQRESKPTDPSLEGERTADILLTQARYFDAAAGYAAAASTLISEGAVADVSRFRALLAKGQEVVSQFVLTSPIPSFSTRVGEPFGAVAEARLTYGSGPQALGVAGVPIRFNYPVKINGRLASNGQTLQTDAQGWVRFPLPVPDWAARASLVAVVDVSAWLSSLKAVPESVGDAVLAWETAVAQRQLSWPLTVESGAKLVPLVIALADFDEKGAVLRRQESTATLVAALEQEGFQVSTVPVNPTLLKSNKDSVILAAWKFQGKKTGRAVYGTVAVVAVTTAGAQASAEVSGTLKVVDLATNNPVYQWKSSRIASGKDRAAAVSQSVRDWAAEAAAQMVAELP